MCCGVYHQNKGHAANAETYPDDREDECNCPGTDANGCCGTKTGDDGKCDRCRENCKGKLY